MKLLDYLRSLRPKCRKCIVVIHDPEPGSITKVTFEGKDAEEQAKKYIDSQNQKVLP